jgi:hypothetical protein
MPTVAPARGVPDLSVMMPRRRWLTPSMSSAGAALDLDALHAVERNRRPADAAQVDRVEALAVEEDQRVAARVFAEAADVDGRIDAEAAIESPHVDPGTALEHAWQVSRGVLRMSSRVMTLTWPPRWCRVR